MAKLDIQVQLRIIDIAEKLANKDNGVYSTMPPVITAYAKNFDQAYKALIKTVQGEGSDEAPKVSHYA